MVGSSVGSDSSSAPSLLLRVNVGTSLAGSSGSAFGVDSPSPVSRTVALLSIDARSFF
jgi:hypothetical protein